jgi:two-component system alkaline phosphatase synthesis response regulator PhoP
VAVRAVVAEDDPKLREMIAETLAAEGVDVAATGDGHEAVRLARDPDVQLLLLDVLLPRISGDVIAELVRRENAATRVILMTGDYGTQFAEAVAQPILHKPFTPERLVAAVREALGDTT